MHFSRPSGQRLSWCLPWNLGAVGRFSSGYWTVSTLRNICRKVTPNPLIGLRKSSTGDLLYLGVSGSYLGVGTSQAPWRRSAGQDPVVVRQVHGRHRERTAVLLDRVSVLRLIRRLAFGGPFRRDIPGEREPDQRQHDP